MAQQCKTCERPADVDDDYCPVCRRREDRKADGPDWEPSDAHDHGRADFDDSYNRRA